MGHHLPVGDLDDQSWERAAGRECDRAEEWTREDTVERMRGLYQFRWAEGLVTTFTPQRER
jgi:hypothetical protein